MRNILLLALTLALLVALAVFAISPEVLVSTSSDEAYTIAGVGWAVIAGLAGLSLAIIGIVILGAVMSGVVLLLVGIAMVVAIAVLFAISPLLLPFALLAVVLWLIFRKRPKEVAKG